MNTTQFDVAVIGAGIVGASCAYHLAQRGLKVVVLEAFASHAEGSTGLSFASIRGQWADDLNTELSWRSIRTYRDIERDHGVDVGYASNGYLMLIPQHAWDRQLESVELQRRHGVPVEVLTVEQAQAITPFDGAGIGGATWGSADGQIDPCAATGAYLTLSHGRGAKTLYNFRVDAIEAGSGGDWVVKAGDRSVRAEHVVNAGGGWAGEVAKLADSMSPSSIHAAMSIPRWREQWMAGTFDAVTPPSQADEAAKTLPHGKVVRFPGIGHDVFIASDCGRQIVADFLSRPDSYDTHCADPMQPPTFVS